MKYFKPDEFKCRCCGSPFRQAQGELASPEIVSNIEALVSAVLDPAREKLGRPIRVNSGYRCPKHNAEVGGVAQSQHLLGEAVDIAPAGFGVQDCPSGESAKARDNSNKLGSPLAQSQTSGFKEELKRLGRIIVEGAKFDQLIIYPTFLHVSYKRHGNNRKQIIIKK